MYLYIDESIFNINDSDFYAVGLLATETEIGRDVVDEALFNLSKDPEIHGDTEKMDMDTLGRGYFHSADDSKNAHSHLCTSIVKYVRGTFRVQYTKPCSQKKVRTIEEIHRLNTQLVSLITTYYHEPVHIFIEQRSSLSQESAEKIIEDLFDEIDRSAYSNAALPAVYPKVTVAVVGKDNPGIQIVDFILWAVKNKYANNRNSRWVDYLSLKISNSFDQPQGDMAGGEYLLNGGIKSPSLGTDVYPPSVFPLEDSYYEKVDFKTIYLWAEQILHSLSTKGLPEHARHFESELNRLCATLKATAFVQEKLIRQVAKLFIRLFDTVPIYQHLDPASDAQKFELLLHVRRCMGLILSGEICGRPAVEVFTKLRSQLISENRDVLYMDPNLPF